MLEDEELQKLSDREIAEDCEVSHVLVWKMRKEQLVNINTSAELPTTETPHQSWGGNHSGSHHFLSESCGMKFPIVRLNRI